MGEHGRRRHSRDWRGPNGLLSKEASSRVQCIDPDQWIKAEESVADLISRIQPTEAAEERRNAVVAHMQRLIMKCFPCQVFVFGSVPLKTYLPDGDIDLTAFTLDNDLKDTWAQKVREMLENEMKNEDAEFCVKEVQYIQAEVQIIKCLVKNIVVDISFNQIGGLCTLCFLAEIDNMISRDHLFKRSIILIKAWCYYESRTLGAHHGLISTYALETLVLYIFHIFNGSFSGPLEVLYHFLDFFSKFDWDNFCVSLSGPVPVASIPDITAEPPRNDGRDLLLNEVFLQTCSDLYNVFPNGLDHEGQPLPPFKQKHLNVIDPLRTNNNLGRSVSTCNFNRIRSAFAFGAKQLVSLLDCPLEHLPSAVSRFFTNTWRRHGSGNRPDELRNDLRLPHMRSPRQGQSKEPCHDSARTSKTGSPLVTSLHGARSTVDHHGRGSPLAASLVNGCSQGVHALVRTHSSPELTDMCGECLSQGTHSQIPIVGEPTCSHKSAVGAGSSVQNPVSHNEKRDCISCKSSSSDAPVGPGSNGVIRAPLKLMSSSFMPRASPPMLSSGGGSYPVNFGAMVPARIPQAEALWNTSVQVPQYFVSSHSTHSFLSNSRGQSVSDNGYFSAARYTNGTLIYESWEEHDHSTLGMFRFCSKCLRLYLPDDVVAYSYTGNPLLTLPGSFHCSRRANRSLSESLWEEAHKKVPRSVEDARGKRTVPSAYRKGKDIAERGGPSGASSDWGPSLTSSFELPQVRLVESYMSFAPVVLNSNSRQRNGNLCNVPLAFYPTGPPVPFVTMLTPMHKFAVPATATGHALRLQFGEGCTETGGPESNFGLPGPHESSFRFLSFLGDTSAGLSDGKYEILCSDFSSHWDNLQYARSCEESRHGNNSSLPPYPLMSPPVNAQGHISSDYQGRHALANMSPVALPTAYGPCLVPQFVSLQATHQPVAVYQHRVEEILRRRSGTGTYLPRPAFSQRKEGTNEPSTNQ